MCGTVLPDEGDEAAGVAHVVGVGLAQCLAQRPLRHALRRWYGDPAPTVFLLRREWASA